MHQCDHGRIVGRCTKDSIWPIFGGNKQHVKDRLNLPWWGDYEEPCKDFWGEQVDLIGITSYGEKRSNSGVSWWGCLDVEMQPWFTFPKDVQTATDEGAMVFTAVRNKLGVAKCTQDIVSEAMIHDTVEKWSYNKWQRSINAKVEPHEKETGNPWFVCNQP